MIPLQLTLKNFLSYRDAVLDFRGLHTACICGANGAGKSSLLEAITWVIWGQSRAASDDDVIYTGAEHVRVDFQFINNKQTYRVIRSRQRGRNSSLEFQIESSQGFRSLTGKGLRATQEQVIISLKLDYDTFINSAYLRQGRADEFMLRRPNERKQILADLLKLDQYEELANQAKDLSKQLKGQTEQLELSLQPLQQQLQTRTAIVVQKTSLETDFQEIHLAQEQDVAKLQQLQAGEHQRQNFYQQLTWQENQYQNLTQDCQRLKTEKSELNSQILALEKLLNQDVEITTHYQELLKLQAQEASLSAKFQAYQEAQQQKQQLEQQLGAQVNEINLQIRQTQTLLETLEQQEQEIQQVLSRSAEIKAGLEQLRHHRQRLNELDKLQHQVAPLLQRRYTLQTDIERAQAKLSAKLEQLQVSEIEYSAQIERIPQIRQAVIAVDKEIGALDKKQVYQKRVEEKGLERKSFQERLQENKRVFEQQIEELQDKLIQIKNPEAICPLCEQTLNEHHRHQIVEKTQAQQQDIQEQVWMIQEQIAVCERELKVLRTEYLHLKEELAMYASLQQKYGQLEAQLENVGEVNLNLKKVKTEIGEIERSLSNSNYALDLHLELENLNQELQRLNYDEQTHALVRGEVEHWRWAEIKQAKLEDATRRQAKINTEKPKLLETIKHLQNESEQLRNYSEIQQTIQQLEQQLQELGYERSQHNNLLATLRQAQTWQLRYQELQQAKQHYPQQQSRLQQLEQLLQERFHDQTTIKTQLDSLVMEIEQISDKREDIQVLEEKIQQRRQKLDEFLFQKGQLEQSLTQLDNLQLQYNQTQKQLGNLRKQYRIYQELGQAFGKNGIQSLMIENILPQLEAETNYILSRLTGNQLHIQFVTQKTGKGSRAKKDAKLIDTLEILIADDQGTRAYETYSGGEAFRINFSIRLALARLLAQRAGTSLQILIVDEGFGTQDTEGCERLIAAINAIAGDFSCILTVTHMPQFKEAFQHRIEIRKTPQGSQISLST